MRLSLHDARPAAGPEVARVRGASRTTVHRSITQGDRLVVRMGHGDRIREEDVDRDPPGRFTASG
ncbi:MAG TPA: hypothetical protein VNO17_11150 [Actinomycetota bacterium]|nr:hypothetical protein [Actinomycetota bacterium]